ncbi:putative tryptophanyl-tRNA synthetase [Xylariaceae sp. FL0804]|nr:putative tryptophanyl-tRNA synthetase [Xylariaceae sp. FL0804]
MLTPVCARCRPLARASATVRRRLVLLQHQTQPQPQRHRHQHQHQQHRCNSTDSGPAGVGVGAETVRRRRNAVVFSGIQPTGEPHLGNYLGAMRQWRRLQDEAAPGDRLLYSIVDLHAITMPQDAERLRLRRREMLAALMAVGLDPTRSVLFYQSSVPQHAELMWILSCTAPVGYLSRMTQWKSKIAVKDQFGHVLEDATAQKLRLGLFSYPVLQAADILVHRATHVPVGDDQRQHLEFARECAKNFNNAYGGDYLVAPETVTTPSPRVMSLQRPESKMSKSTPNESERILITATPEEIHRRIRHAVTDSDNRVTYDPVGRPGVANLLELLAQCSPPSSPSSSSSSSSSPSPSNSSPATSKDSSNSNSNGGSETRRMQRKTPEQLAAELAGAPLAELKARAAAAVAAELEGVRDRYRYLLARSGGRELDDVEAEGARVARRSAEETMRRVRYAVGLAARP